MSTKIPLVEFDATERVSIEVIHRQSATIAADPLTSELLNSVLNYVFILNRQRQIVFVSQNCKDLVSDQPLESLLGLRPGEALGCRHVAGTQASCGSTPFCAECGAAKAFFSSMLGQKQIQECHLTRIINCQPQAVDLLIYAIPFSCKDETYSIFSVADISHEKRRQALERIFFHDVINTAGSLEGLVAMLEQEVRAEQRGDLELLHRGLQELLEVIHSQQDLAAAESDELELRPAPIESLELLQTETKLFEHHPLAARRRVAIDPQSVPVSFEGDATLLQRILGNLIKNALEAIQEGQTVTVSCLRENHHLRFWVHNPGVMTREAQLQVFNRSYSTKGTGRGLGTYSVKLLTEKYLHGNAGFSSNLDLGTVFWVSIPIRLEMRASAPPQVSRRTYP
jgi:signal transduction histidine kinase